MDNNEQKKQQGQPGLTRLKLLIHGGYFFFISWVGIRFFLFWLWASGQSQSFVSRPAAVEGFLPIGGLVSLKILLTGGGWDRIHPAGLTIFIAALGTSLIFRKGFCGWVCPVGFFSWLIQKTGEKLGWIITPPPMVNYILMGLKYLILAFFLYIIAWKMPRPALEKFSRNPYNLAVDARMLLFFLDPSATAAVVMSTLVVGSIFVKNLWCRYLCPYGAILGLFAMISPAAVVRDEKKCINCQRCDKACPGGIRVSGKTRVNSPECVGCLQCVAGCPVDGCIETRLGGRSLSRYLIPAGVLTMMLGMWIWALANGHWHTELTNEVFKNLYPLAGQLTHP